MALILGITFPIYAAIAIGYLAVRFRWFQATDMAVLGKYVLNVALPALIFNAVATRDLGDIFHPGYVSVFLIGGLLTILVSFVWFNFTAPDPGRRAVAVMGSSCPNSGFIGFPLMLLVFPDLAGLILAINMMVENMVLIPICLILMDLARPREQDSIASVLSTMFLDLFKRPMIIGLVLGLIVSAIGLTLPGALERLLQMLAASASALALVVIGGSLASLPLKGNRILAVQIAIGKLVLHPALVAITATVLIASGLITLTDDLRIAAILSAAIPMFGIYTVFAQERGLGGAASIAMLTATTGAFATLSLLLFWLA
ncbi:AEC family transporter [Arenibacterium sp. CAU 1754]